MAKRHIRLFGLLVERKTDILAFAAFLISLATVSIQVSAYLRGSDVGVIVPTFVSVYENPCLNPEVPQVDLVAQVMARNSGAIGYGEVIRRIFVSVFFDGTDGPKHYFEVSSQVVEEENNFAVNHQIDCTQRTDGTILDGRGTSVVKTEDFQPPLIEGGAVFSQTLLFGSTVLECNIDKSCKNLVGQMSYAVFLAQLEAKRQYRITTVLVTGENEAILGECRGLPTEDEVEAARKWRRVDLHCETDFKLPI